MSTLENVNLTGHLLIAMPGMTDPFFSKSVTFICTHNQDGAMGVMINRPTDLSYETLFEKIKPTYNLPKTTDLLFLGTNSTILLIYLKPTKEVSTVLVSKIIVLSVLG